MLNALLCFFLSFTTKLFFFRASLRREHFFLLPINLPYRGLLLGCAPACGWALCDARLRHRGVFKLALIIFTCCPVLYMQVQANENVSTESVCSSWGKLA